jgi:carbonic anhydrase
LSLPAWYAQPQPPKPRRPPPGQHADDASKYNLGIEQSPIDIPSSTPTHSPDIEFNYQPMPLTIVNNSHTIQVNADGNSFIEVEGDRYNLLQFHFHALSEHTYGGKHTPMEVHFVHQSESGEYLVVGIFLGEGDANADYAPVFDNLPAQPGEPDTVQGVSLDTIELMPEKRSYYRYAGSFTTPPYTEGVKWFVMAEPLELSARQIVGYTALYPDNFRPVQPIHERKFIVGSSSCGGCKTGAPGKALGKAAAKVVKTSRMIDAKGADAKVKYGLAAAEFVKSQLAGAQCKDDDAAEGFDFEAPPLPRFDAGPVESARLDARAGHCCPRRAQIDK